jgi:hypothetical protein
MKNMNDLHIPDSIRAEIWNSVLARNGGPKQAAAVAAARAKRPEAACSQQVSTGTVVHDAADDEPAGPPALAEGSRRRLRAKTAVGPGKSYPGELYPPAKSARTDKRARVVDDGGAAGRPAKSARVGRREQLCPALDEGRKAAAESMRKPRLHMCTEYTHVCAIDKEFGCRSCSRMCHTDCTSVLCQDKPCEFCLSFGEIVAAGSPECSGFQRRHGCHSCGRNRCWNFSPTCLGSRDDSVNAQSAGFASADSSLAPPGTCLQYSHRCCEDRDDGCQSCMKTCHRDNTSPLCPYFGRDRGQLAWTPNADDMLDTQRFLRDLRGRRRHRTQFQWQREGRDAEGRRIVHIPGEGYHYLGVADGHDCNCFVYSLEQCVEIATDVDAVRTSLQVEFPRVCGVGCSPTADACTGNCMKVYPRNYLSTDHWSAVLRSIGQHARAGPQNVDESHYCLRVMDLAYDGSGVVLGNPSAPRRITVARENRNHFVPVLPYPHNTEGGRWLPW